MPHTLMSIPVGCASLQRAENGCALGQEATYTRGMDPTATRVDRDDQRSTRANHLRHRRRKAWIGSVVLLTLSGAVGFWLSAERSDRPAETRQSVNPEWQHLREAPRFTLPNDQSQPRRLSEFAGQIVVVHFWATWCAPCLEEVPQFIDAARSFEGKPITFIAVSLDTQWKDAHRFFKPETLPKTVVSLLDAKNTIAEEFGTFQFPETYVLTPDLRIIKKWVGPQQWESAELRGFLTGLIQKAASP